MRRPARGAADATEDRANLSLLARLLREHKAAVLGAAILGLMAVAALFAGLITPYDPLRTFTGPALQGPSLRHPFGTDAIGRDVLSRAIYGLRPSLYVGAGAVAIGAVVGGLTGMVAGYARGRIEALIMRVWDVVFALPIVLIGIALVAVLGANARTDILAVAIGSTPAFARIMRASVIRERSLDYVTAARAFGASHTRVLFRHIVPNTLGPLFVQVALWMSIAVLMEASLTFLGLGTQPPTPSLGGMLADSQTYLTQDPAYSIFPGLTIVVFVIALNLIADGAQAVFDPKASNQRIVTRREHGRQIDALQRANTALPLTESLTDQSELTGDVVLDVRSLTVAYKQSSGDLEDAVRDVSFQVRRGETFALVGESGCGKSATALALLRLLDLSGVVRGGAALFNGRDLLRLSQTELQKVRGKGITVIFQDPTSALNPVLTIGGQIAEALRVHDARLGKREALAQAAQLLADVGMREPDRWARRYPHECSGGMRQRVMIAMAIANRPQLIIADEPTTALDVTLQAEILKLLRRAQIETGAAMIFITHDLALVSEIADRTGVMYAGKIVEQGPTASLIQDPKHPYTAGLLSCVPRIDQRVEDLYQIPGAPPHLGEALRGCSFAPRCPIGSSRTRCVMQEPILRTQAAGRSAACHYSEKVTRSWAQASRSADTPEVIRIERAGQSALLAIENLTVDYHDSAHRRSSSVVHAVIDVSLDVAPGTTLGIVGESGSGKSTLARTIIKLEKPVRGAIYFRGQNVIDASAAQLRKMRREMQIVFQDPYGSLNPRMPIFSQVAEPLLVDGVRDRAVVRERVKEALDLTGVDFSRARRYPHEFSGGQRQRIAIARALILRPSLLILDEPVSALDVSVQATILNLLRKIQRELDLTYVFISHDLSVIRQVADEVAVMYMGQVVERGPTSDVLDEPRHAYTRTLLDAVPRFSEGVVVRQPDRMGS